MPPKKSITREQVIDAGFEIVRSGRSEELTARGIARELGKSVNPIYCEFSSMEELEKAVFMKAAGLFNEYQTEEQGDKTFLNTGMGYIEFARNESALFQWMFTTKQLPENYQKEQLHCFLENTFNKIKDIAYFQSFEPEVLKEIIFEIWIFVHGLAALISQQAVEPMETKEIQKMLSRMFKAIVATKKQIQNEEVTEKCQ